jgi:sugar phosphate isomerase/epimerase
VKLALPNTVFKRSSVEEVAAAVAAHGAEAVEYFLALSGGLPDVEGCRRIRRAFESNGVAIDHVGGYVNPISTDPELRRAGVEHLKGLCRLSGDLGSRMIATFSGTAVPATGLEWTPESHSQASYDLFIEVIRDVLRVAAAKGVTILIEPFVVTVMKDPDTALRIFEDVGSPHLGLAMDIVNFYNLADLEQPRQNELMDECFTKLGPYIRAIHAKDMGPQDGPRPTPGKPGIGRGVLDYAHFAGLVHRSGFEGPVLVEVLRSEEMVAPSMAHVRRFLGGG